jgi:predicted dehydrogenase
MYDRARSGGGVVANLSSHLLFVLCWTFGLPTRVEASWRHVHSRVEDELDAMLDAPGGVAIRFESSWCVPGFPISRTVLQVEGEHGTVAVSNDALDLTLARPACGLPAGSTHLGPADLPQPAGFELNGEAYSLEDAHFLRWITGGAPPAIDADAALAVQVVMDALYRSAERGGVAIDVATEC